MKTAYLIKSPSKNISFDSDRARGLIFVNSVLDLTFLNNSVFNGNLKIIVQQSVGGETLGTPTLWFLVFDQDPMSTEALEKAWKYASKVGAMLYPYTRMGQRFSYNDVWTFSDIPNDWTVEQTYIQFRDNGRFEAIYFHDPEAKVVEENGETGLLLKGKTVNADFIAVVSNEQNLRQSHFIHLSVPGNWNVDTGPFHQGKDVLDRMRETGFPIEDPTKIYILELFNRSVSHDDIFLSIIALYQIVEVILRFSNSDRLEDSAVDELSQFLTSHDHLSAFKDRIISSVRNISLQTSNELLKLGLDSLLGEEASDQISSDGFREWRRLRGKLAHPTEAVSVTEEEFVHAYKTLRTFCEKVAREICIQHEMLVPDDDLP